jgi:hypothetical protein
VLTSVPALHALHATHIPFVTARDPRCGKMSPGGRTSPRETPACRVPGIGNHSGFAMKTFPMNSAFPCSTVTTTWVGHCHHVPIFPSFLCDLGRSEKRVCLPVPCLQHPCSLPSQHAVVVVTLCVRSLACTPPACGGLRLEQSLWPQLAECAHLVHRRGAACPSESGPLPFAGRTHRPHCRGHRISDLALPQQPEPRS